MRRVFSFSHALWDFQDILRIFQRTRPTDWISIRFLYNGSGAEHFYDPFRFVFKMLLSTSPKRFKMVIYIITQACTHILGEHELSDTLE